MNLIFYKRKIPKYMTMLFVMCFVVFGVNEASAQVAMTPIQCEADFDAAAMATAALDYANTTYSHCTMRVLTDVDVAPVPDGDDCTSEVIIHIFRLVADCSDNAMVDPMFVRNISVSQVITRDLTPPTVMTAPVPDGGDVNCTDAWPPAAPTDPVGTDGTTCGGVVSVTPVGDFPALTAPDACGLRTATYSWRLEDACGNGFIHRSVFTQVMDDADVVFAAVPVATTVECVADVPGDPGVSASHPCSPTGGFNVVFTQDMSGLNADCNGNGTVINTWTATAACDATIVAVETQTVTINDVTGPVFTGGTFNIVLPVDGDCELTVPDMTASLVATDNCGVAGTGVVTFTQNPAIGTAVPTSVDGCGPAGPRVGLPFDVVVTATDCDGNSTDFTRQIVPIDNIAPVIDVPAAGVDVMVDFDGVTCQMNSTIVDEAFLLANGVTITDNCEGDPTPSLVGTGLPMTFTCSDIGSTVTVTLNGNDCNGNNAIPVDVVLNIIGDIDFVADWVPQAILCPANGDIPFDLNAWLLPGTPTCGTWGGGPFVAADGTFTVPGPGIYAVTYTVGGPTCHIEVTQNVVVFPNIDPDDVELKDLNAGCLLPSDVISLWGLLDVIDNDANGIGAFPGGLFTIGAVTGDLVVSLTPGIANLVYTSGSGTVEINYTIIDCAGVPEVGTAILTITEEPQGSFNMPSTMCQADAPFNLEMAQMPATVPVGWTIVYTGTGVTGTMFDPAALAEGNYVVTMTISNGTCTYAENQVVNVNQSPAVSPSFNFPEFVCLGNSIPLALNNGGLDLAGNALTDANVNWTGENTQDLGVAGNFNAFTLGVFTVCVETGDPTCSQTECKTVTVIPPFVADNAALIDDFSMCLTPDAIIDFSSVLDATAVPIVGVLVPVAGVPVLLGSSFNATAPVLVGATGTINPNSFVYTGGNGTLTLTYTVSNPLCGNLFTDVVVITLMQSPDVTVTGTASPLCFHDEPASFFASGTTSIPNAPIADGIWQLFTQPAGALAPGITFQNSTQAIVDPEVAGEGTFRLKYIVGDKANDCVAEIFTEIVIKDAGDATFTLANSEICVGETLALALDNNTLSPLPADHVDEIEWFGGNANGVVTDNGEDAEFTSTVPGTYTICVTVGDAGCEDIFCQDITVVEPVPNAPSRIVSVECTIAPDGTVALTELFQGINNEFLDNQTANVTITVGGDAGASLIGSSVKYTRAGCYSVRWEYDDTSSCDEDRDVTSFIYVSERPQPNFDIQNEVCWSVNDPAAAHRFDPTVNSNGYVTDPVREWTVVSGPATVINPINGRIEVTGVGVVRLRLRETITNPACSIAAAKVCSDTYTVTITVQDGTAQDASFTMDPLNACPGATVVLTAATAGGEFTGPGVVDDGNGMTGTFTVPSCGFHAITYTLNTTAGCTASYTTNYETDNTDPVLTAPVSTEQECDNIVMDLVTWLATATATDETTTGCTVAVTSQLFNTISGCGNTNEEIYEFTATDACGNTDVKYASYKLIDTTDPVITTQPTLLTFECNEVGNISEEITTWLNSNGGAVGTDGCGLVVWSNDYAGLSDACGLTGTATVVFTATDQCGNSIDSDPVTVTVTDANAPTITAPADITIQCDGDASSVMAIVEVWKNGAVAIDGCDGTVLVDVVVAPITGVCHANIGTMEVTFDAMDACGNAATQVIRTVTVEDIEKPEFDIPADLTIDCSDAWPDMPAIPAMDCEPGLMANATHATATGQCPREQIRTVTYTATDCSGNETVKHYTITKIDNTAPEFTAIVAPAPLECSDGNGSDLAMNWAAGVAASNPTTDDCSSVTVGFELKTFIDECGETGRYQFEFKATDACGNYAFTNVNVYVVDTEAPEIVAPSNILVPCDGDAARTREAIIEAWENDAVAFDTCDEDILVMKSRVFVPGCHDRIGVYTYTFTAEDDCGNQAVDVIRTVTVIDQEEPEFDIPADRTIDCSANWPNLNPRSTSDCEQGVMAIPTFVDAVGECEAEMIRTVTYTATDCSGNESAKHYTITRMDSTAPTFTVAVDPMVECDVADADAWAATAVSAIVEDCSATETTYALQGIVETCENSAVYTYIFTVTDACGNATSMTGTYTYEDTTVPVLTCPDAITICNVENGKYENLVEFIAAGGVATDNCGLNEGSFGLLNEVIAGTTVTRTYEIADACGNKMTCDQVITLTDPFDPCFEMPLTVCENAGDLDLDMESLSPGLAASITAMGVDTDVASIWEVRAPGPIVVGSGTSSILLTEDDVNVTGLANGNATLAIQALADTYGFGVYTVIHTIRALDCESSCELEFELLDTPEPTVSTSTPIVCLSNSIELHIDAIDGGTSPFDVEWTEATSGYTSGVSNITVDDLVHTTVITDLSGFTVGINTFEMTIVDSEGCSTTVEVEVAINADPTVGPEMVNSIFCVSNKGMGSNPTEACDSTNYSTSVLEALCIDACASIIAPAGVAIPAATTNWYASATSTEKLYDLDSDNDGVFDAYIEAGKFDPIAAGLVDPLVPGSYSFYAECVCIPTMTCISPRAEATIEILDCEADSGECTYLLVMEDTGSNGWDGAMMNVMVDENMPGTNYHLTVSDCDLKVIPITTGDGGFIDLTYMDGAFNDEHKWFVLDPLGNIATDIYGNPVTYGPGGQPSSAIRIKLDCPVNCDETIDYVVAVKMGASPMDQSWELKSGGNIVAYAYPGQYAGLAPGDVIFDTVSMNSCSDYTFTTYDGTGLGWANGKWYLLGTDADRGLALTRAWDRQVYDAADAGHFVLDNGPDSFTFELNDAFTIPCKPVDCPADVVLQTSFSTNGCELPGFVPTNIPTPSVCYPNCGHALPSSSVSVTVSYPGIGLFNQSTTTAVTLPAGENDVVFNIVYSNDGQIVRCSSLVSVVTDLNPELSCNDHVIISLRQPSTTRLLECRTRVMPDMVLEMPQMCVGDYKVSLVDANGNLMGDIVGPEHIGTIWDYQVIAIGSGTICWGTLSVEDKNAPVIECTDYTVNCNHPGVMDANYSRVDSYAVAAGLPGNIAGNAGSNSNVAFDVSCAPIGEIVTNIVVGIENNHTRSADLLVTLTAPNGLSTTSTVPMQARHLAVFNGMSYTDAQGEWTLAFVDNNGAFAAGTTDVGKGIITAIDVDVTVGFPKLNIAFDCSLDTYEMIDQSLVETDCDGSWNGKTIVRTWQAIDLYGNSSVCTQNVNLVKPSLSDVTLTGDIELECGDVSSNPAEITPDVSGAPMYSCYPISGTDHTICDISYTYTDIVIATCGQGYKILRTWTVLDWCSGNERIFEQTIKVHDSIGPVIAQDDITIGTGNTCTGSLVLGNIPVTDGCSGVVGLIATYEVGGLGGFDITGTLNVKDLFAGQAVDDLPMGTTVVKIDATDGCGNVTTKMLNITVEDNTAPIATCDDQLNTTLGSDGTSRLTAEQVDEGSADNCGDVTLEVRRVGGCLPTSAWGPYVEFACCDKDQLVTVELRVTDEAGNSNVCWKEVLVEDAIAPIITTPADKTINCDENVEFGDATAEDNCDVEITFTDSGELDNCKAGTLTRTWTATDGSEKSADATGRQRITVNHVSDFIVQFPADITLATCPDELGNTGEPTIQDDDCELIAISKDDQIFDIVDDACYKIVRTWTVSNWCTVDLGNSANTDLGFPLPVPRTFRDDGDGYMQWVQIIKVLDNNAPVIDCPGDQTFCDLTDGCEGEAELVITATDDCSDVAALTYAYQIDLDNDGTYDESGSDSDASGTYAYGTHRILWAITDGCGNEETCEYNFTIEDCKKPTPVCLNGVSIPVMDLGDTGCVEIWASDLLEYAFDNCTDDATVEASVKVRKEGTSDALATGVTFCCDELGTQIVEIWVEDAAGNADYCTTYVIVQDNMDVCPEGPTTGSRISGFVKTMEDEALEGAMVHVDGPSVTMSDAIPTGVAGSFFELFANGYDYTVSAEKNDDPLNGVSTYDVILMTQHVLGSNIITDPYMVIAADVNNDGQINISDIIALRKLVLYIDKSFQANTSWRFFDKATGNEVVDIENLAIDTNIDFLAIKIGDLDMSAKANALSASGRNANGTLNFSIDEIEMIAGNQYKVDFRAEDFAEVTGYQFTLNFDTEALNYVNVEAGAIALAQGNVGTTLLDNGVITTSWNGDASVNVQDDAVLFSVVFEATSNTSLSNAIEISSRYTVAEAYTISDLKEVSLTFNTNEGSLVASKFALYQNKPNPFNNETLISFNLPEASTATLSIFDVSGRVIKVIGGDYARGYNEVSISRSELSTSGIMYYQLDTDNDSAVKKMIMID